jgi:hypothetical protein
MESEDFTEEEVGCFWGVDGRGTRKVRALEFFANTKTPKRSVSPIVADLSLTVGNPGKLKNCIFGPSRKLPVTLLSIFTSAQFM